MILTLLEGTVDADYRGWLFAFVRNFGLSELKIKRGQRFAQIIFTKYCNPAGFVEVEDIEKAPTSECTKSTRGEGGCGSTGSF